MKSSIKFLKIIVNLIISALLIVFCIFFLPQMIRFFMPFIIGWFISMVANPLVRFLEKKVKIVRKAGSAFVIITVMGLIALLAYAVVVNLLQQLIAFLKNLPETWMSVEADLLKVGTKLTTYYDKLPMDVQERFIDLQMNFSTYVGDLVSSFGTPTVEAASSFAKNIPLLIIYIIMTLMSAYFFIADREMVLEFVRKNTSESIKVRFSLVYNSLKQAVGGYFEAQIKIMAVVAIILLIGFSILKVQYAILFSVLIAILDFLPFFGTGTVMIPWAFIKFISGDYKMAVGLLIIWGVSQLVRQVIQPKIVGDSMGMPALPTLFLLYIGFRIWGAFGLIIAVPIGLIIYNLYKAGIFSNTLKSIKLLLEEINKFRKFDDE
ncbi:MAG: sporulation integral membrane protein YtvI [Lachnospiraceae bacterium]|nr:sporulation integral membrane protein YtvI [Lachnospiraceae bacterium]